MRGMPVHMHEGMGTILEVFTVVVLVVAPTVIVAAAISASRKDGIRAFLRRIAIPSLIFVFWSVLVAAALLVALYVALALFILWATP
ncbi:hypothetical protein [Nocardia sp. NPDC050789]|uniref:hypothetical protein n=1 Tax=Nocardia sp. NPDC050789 TaxID=3154841 RepID=UPI0033E78806